jgi:hypothetical protein
VDVDIDKSIAFIESRGSDLERARLNCILYGTQPDRQVIRNLNDLQNIDGGFPFGMVKCNLSTINDTTVALWWMEELVLLSTYPGRRAFSFLLSRQLDDGSWNENPQISQYDLPHWIQLDDRKTILYLSAYAAYWLVVGGYSTTPALRKAYHYLIRNQDKSGEFYGYLHTTWIATGMFLMLGERYRNIADLGLRYLADMDPSSLDDSQIAWELDCLSKGGMANDHPYIKECLLQLTLRQKPDGSWASEDGEAFAVGATIQAVKVLKRFSQTTLPADGDTD